MRKHFLRTLVVAALVAGALLVPAAASAAPPANDDFANATVISSLPFSDSVDATEATDAGLSEPQPCYQPSHTIWYAFTPSQDETVRADALGGLFDTTLTVYQGGGLGFAGCTAFGGSVTFDAQSGTTYYFQLGTYFGGGGTENLNVAVVPPPVNDDFADSMAIDPSSLPFSDTQSGLAATLESGEPTASCSIFGPANNSWWYSFTPTSTRSYRISSSSGTLALVALYSGSSLDGLSEQGCRPGANNAFSLVLTQGVTYHIQVADYYGGVYGPISLSLGVAPDPVASFAYNPVNPSPYDLVHFVDGSSDPGGNAFSSEVWHFGDGTSQTNPGQFPTHQYAKDGDYAVELDVTTIDGRTASTQQVVQVRTHDVSVAKVVVPQTARVGQSKAISVGLTNHRYAETVQVELFKSVAGGDWQQVGVLSQYVPVRGANRTTDFDFNYTFAPEDAVLGKVNFRAVATIQAAQDAFPTDNTFISMVTKVSK